jgi:hypothetical protein
MEPIVLNETADPKLTDPRLDLEVEAMKWARFLHTVYQKNKCNLSTKEDQNVL